MTLFSEPLYTQDIQAFAIKSYQSCFISRNYLIPGRFSWEYFGLLLEVRISFQFFLLRAVPLPIPNNLDVVSHPQSDIVYKWKQVACIWTQCFLKPLNVPYSRFLTRLPSFWPKVDVKGVLMEAQKHYSRYMSSSIRVVVHLDAESTAVWQMSKSASATAWMFLIPWAWDVSP